METTVWGFYSSTVFFIDSNCPFSLITTTNILKSHYDLKKKNAKEGLGHRLLIYFKKNL